MLPLQLLIYLKILDLSSLRWKQVDDFDFGGM